MPLGGSWEAGLGLEILPKTRACAPLNTSPVGCTGPRFVEDIGFIAEGDGGPTRHLQEEVRPSGPSIESKGTALRRSLMPI